MTATVNRAEGAAPAVLSAPPCWFCTEAERYDLSVGRESEGVDPGVVRWDGKVACFWHAAFHWGHEPADVAVAMGFGAAREFASNASISQAPR